MDEVQKKSEEFFSNAFGELKDMLDKRPPERDPEAIDLPPKWRGAQIAGMILDETQALVLVPLEDAEVEEAQGEDGICHCKRPVNLTTQSTEFSLEIEEGMANLLHTACGKPPQWWASGDSRELLSMAPVPIVLDSERQTCFCGYDGCDCDWWLVANLPEKEK